MIGIIILIWSTADDDKDAMLAVGRVSDRIVGTLRFFSLLWVHQYDYFNMKATSKYFT